MSILDTILLALSTVKSEKADALPVSQQPHLLHRLLGQAEMVCNHCAEQRVVGEFHRCGGVSCPLFVSEARSYSLSWVKQKPGREGRVPSSPTRDVVGQTIPSRTHITLRIPAVWTSVRYVHPVLTANHCKSVASYNFAVAKCEMTTVIARRFAQIFRDIFRNESGRVTALRGRDISSGCQ